MQIFCDAIADILIVVQTTMQRLTPEQRNIVEENKANKLKAVKEELIADLLKKEKHLQEKVN